MNFNTAKFTLSAANISQLPDGTIGEIVFCGRSNVGKSTLINKLCGVNGLARVSQTPGKTATINVFTANSGFLIDLPGYGYAKRSKQEIVAWGELMNGYFLSGRNIKLALLLLDCRRTPNDDDIEMLRFFKAASIPFVAVLTKTDKLKKSELSEAETEITNALVSYSPLAILKFSANEHATAVALREAVSRLAGI